MSRVRTKRNGARELARDMAGLPKAMNRALNEGSRGLRTDAVRYLTQRYTMPAGRVRKYVKAKPDRGRGRAGVEIKGPAPSLSYFRHTPRGITAQMKRPPRAGAGVQVMKSQGRVRMPHVFKAEMRNGHKGLFRRGFKAYYYPGSPRLPIHEVHGPTPSKSMTRAEAVRYMEKRMNYHFVHRALHRHILHAKDRGWL